MMQFEPDDTEVRGAGLLRYVLAHVGATTALVLLVAVGIVVLVISVAFLLAVVSSGMIAFGDH